MSETTIQTTLKWLSSYTGCNNHVDLSQQSGCYDDKADLCCSVLHGRSLTHANAQQTGKKALLYLLVKDS